MSNLVRLVNAFVTVFTNTRNGRFNWNMDNPSKFNFSVGVSLRAQVLKGSSYLYLKYYHAMFILVTFLSPVLLQCSAETILITKRWSCLYDTERGLVILVIILNVTKTRCRLAIQVPKNLYPYKCLIVAAEWTSIRWYVNKNLEEVTTTIFQSVG